MDKFLPYMTNDYSVGLYCEESNDIYHSAHGALTEAFEKFVEPLDLGKYLIDKTGLRVLDICYGIGYNTKALLNTVLDIPNLKVDIDCVDTNKVLMKLSPFIKSKIGLLDRIFKKKDLIKNIDGYNEAKKIISCNCQKEKKRYKIKNDVNLILYRELYQNCKIDLDIETENLLSQKENFVFFDKCMLNFHKFLSKKEDRLSLNNILSTYLHNIYYKIISKRYFNGLYNNIHLHFFNQDVRDFIKNSDSKYDIIFLDGFTPLKCPCIWSQDFFYELYSAMHDDSLLVTYNTSAVIRAALLNVGFYIGNILNDNNTIGTIAVKNKRFIKNKLTNKQLGLLGTKAGIPFRDKYLSLDNDIIIKNRELEIKNSTLESSSKYLKRCQNET